MVRSLFTFDLTQLILVGFFLFCSALMSVIKLRNLDSGILELSEELSYSYYVIVFV